MNLHSKNRRQICCGIPISAKGCCVCRRQLHPCEAASSLDACTPCGLKKPRQRTSIGGSTWQTADRALPKKLKRQANREMQQEEIHRKWGKTIINRRRKPTWKNPIRRKAAEGNEARFTPGQKKGRILLTSCLTEALKRWRTRWFLCFFC